MKIFRASYYAVLSTNTSSNVSPLFTSKEKSVKVYLTSFFETKLLLLGGGDICTSAVEKRLTLLLWNPTALRLFCAGGQSNIYIFVLGIQFNSLNYSH